MYFVYVVSCADGSLYTGIASDVCRRLSEHVGKSPACAKYTRSHPVIGLEGLWRAPDKSAALRLEAAIKSLPKAKKCDLLAHPEAVGEFFEPLSAILYTPCKGVTLSQCVDAASGCLSEQEMQALQQILMDNVARFEMNDAKHDLHRNARPEGEKQRPEADRSIEQPGNQ